MSRPLRAWLRARWPSAVPTASPDGPPGPLQTGDQLAGHRIERVIAHGASGVLYLAFEPLRGRPRALKVLAPPALLPAAERELAEQRFLRESAALRQLAHPAIVRLHDAGIAGGLPYLVMSLLPGTDLRRHAAPARRLPEAVVFTMGARLAEALAHAHARGIVHRDVKPGNIVFDPARRRVWLTDFGAARLADAEATRTGLLLGTPSFMAPEQLAGAPADPRGDVYALGITLFQLLSSRLPFEGASLGQLLQSMARGTAADLRGLRPDLPQAAAQLLANMLRRDPADRPTAAAAAQCLQQLADPAPR